MRKALRFIGELKRRSVYGVAVAYIVVGLGVLGAADVILDPLGLGDARPIIVIVTLLGFPLAMVLAWIYDLTPAGLVRDSETNLEGAESEAPKPASRRASRHPTASALSAETRSGTPLGAAYPRNFG